LLEEGGYQGDLSEFRFLDFLDCVQKAPIETLNEHWMPQHLHLMDDVSYDVIDMAAIARHPKLSSIYTELGSNVRGHAAVYGDKVPGADRMVPNAILRYQARHKAVPGWESFASDAAYEAAEPRFGPDRALVASAWKGD